jgi:hypothetical protein
MKMLLIETRRDGVLIKKHWHAVEKCKTREDAAKKIEFMNEMFGHEYEHTAREMSPDDIPEYRVSVFRPKKINGIESRSWDYDGGLPG